MQQAACQAGRLLCLGQQTGARAQHIGLCSWARSGSPFSAAPQQGDQCGRVVPIKVARIVGPQHAHIARQCARPAPACPSTPPPSPHGHRPPCGWRAPAHGRAGCACAFSHAPGRPASGNGGRPATSSKSRAGSTEGDLGLVLQSFGFMMSAMTRFKSFAVLSAAVGAWALAAGPLAAQLADGARLRCSRPRGRACGQGSLDRPREGIDEGAGGALFLPRGLHLRFDVDGTAVVQWGFHGRAWWVGRRR